MDFENPTFAYILEDWLKYHFAGLVYAGHVKDLKLTGDEFVLDFGCGGGACAKLIARTLWPQGHVTCVDTSKYWLNKAKKRLCKFSNVGFLFADISRLGIPEGFYNVVSIHFVLHDL